MKPIFVCVAALVLTGSAFAKLPAPSDEAKAKAAEAAAKTAHAGKVDAFQLCKAQDKVAARANKAAKAATKDSKDSKSVAPASSCVDPGPFVYTPPAAPAMAGASAPATAVAVTPPPAPVAATSAMGSDKSKKP